MLYNVTMKKDYDDFDWSTCTQDRWYTKSLFEFARHFPFQKGLEIGFGSGSSALAFLRGCPSAQLLSIDLVYPEEAYNFYLGTSDMAKRHDLLLENSENFLPELIASGRKFDFVYIDGDHRFEPALQDIGNSVNLLSERGIIVIDDCSPEMNLGVYKALIYFLNRTNVEFNVTPLMYSTTGAVVLEKKS